MIARTFLYLAVAAALSALPGCAADANQNDEATGASADEIISNGGNANGLRSLTIMKGTMTEGGQLKVAYEPSLYEPMWTLPFLAIEVLPSTPAADQGDNGNVGDIRPMNDQLQTTINVTGDFPGSPRVLVVDEEFNVLAATNGRANGFGHDVAQLTVPNTNARKLILVRDMKWVRPMEFMVQVGM